MGLARSPLMARLTDFFVAPSAAAAEGDAAPAAAAADGEPAAAAAV